MNKWFTRFAGKASDLTGSSWAFLAAVAVIIIWGVTGPLFGFSDTWQLVINTGTTIITFLMVFLIQNTQNRDGAAMQAKLDELVYAVKKADARFIGIEHLTDKELDLILEEVEKRGNAIHEGNPPPAAARSFRKRSASCGRAL